MIDFVKKTYFQMFHPEYEWVVCGIKNPCIMTSIFSVWEDAGIKMVIQERNDSQKHTDLGVQCDL